jgi:hypothetical protein
MIVAVVFILTAGGVFILRPIAKRAGELLDLYTRDKQSGLEGEVRQIRDLLETTNARLHLLEERQDFTERLLSGEREKDRATRIGPG